MKHLAPFVLALLLAAPAYSQRIEPPPPAGGEGFGIDAELCLDGVSDFADLGTVYNKALSQGFVLELEITLDPKGARAEQWVLRVRQSRGFCCSLPAGLAGPSSVRSRYTSFRTSPARQTTQAGQSQNALCRILTASLPSPRRPLRRCRHLARRGLRHDGAERSTIPQSASSPCHIQDSGGPLSGSAR